MLPQTQVAAYLANRALVLLRRCYTTGLLLYAILRFTTSPTTINVILITSQLISIIILICRVEEHPPGEKAMHDFKDVLAYNLDRRRRSPVKQPAAKEQAAGDGAAAPVCNNTKAPARKPAAAKARLTPALSPKNDNVKMPSSTGGAHQGKMDSEGRQDYSAPKSTARHPAPSAGDAHEAPDATAAALGSPDSIVAGTSAVASALPTAPAAPAANATAATAVKTRPFVTPANRRKAIQTPSSRPSTSRNHAALADGQFQPTPLPNSTPAATVIANKGNNGSFRSPQPRTVFGNKKRAANSMEESKIGGGNNNNTSSIARLATSSSPVAAPKSAGRSGKKQQTAPTSTREPMESLPINLSQFGKGPVLNKPDSCPPLFKKSASTGVLGKRPLPPLPPLPAPSAQKASQAVALSGQFFSQEKGLLAFMSDKQNKQGQAKQQQQQQQYPALMPRPPMPLVVPAIAPLVTAPAPIPAAPAAPVPAVGSSLGWAFSQLRQQQNKE